MSKFSFTQASRTKARSRIALIGPSGSGKTYSALRIARGLAGPDGRIAVIDTEHGSASKYAGTVTDFDVLELDHHGPETYVQAIQAADAAGYDVLVIDSLSHAWSGRDGALEQVDNAAKRSRSGNSYAAWRDVTPKHNALIDAIVGCKCHVIATMRAKTEYVIEQVKGKSVPKKIGLAAVQRDGMEYEFDIVADMDLEHNMLVSKTRMPGIDGAVIALPGENFGATVGAWLNEGVDAPVNAPVRDGRAALEKSLDAIEHKHIEGNGNRDEDELPEPARTERAPEHWTPLIEGATDYADLRSVLGRIMRSPDSPRRFGALKACASALVGCASVDDLEALARDLAYIDKSAPHGKGVGAIETIVTDALAVLYEQAGEPVAVAS